jgi:hypothetical protein
MAGARVVRLNTNRFHPSIAFEVVILLFLIVQTYIVYRENSNVGSFRAFLNQPWIALELTTLGLFVIVFVLDIRLLLKVQKVHCPGISPVMVLDCAAPGACSMFAVAFGYWTFNTASADLGCCGCI